MWTVWQIDAQSQEWQTPRTLTRLHEVWPWNCTGWPKIVALFGVPGDCDRKLWSELFLENDLLEESQIHKSNLCWSRIVSFRLVRIKSYTVRRSNPNLQLKLVPCRLTQLQIQRHKSAVSDKSYRTKVKSLNQNLNQQNLSKTQIGLIIIWITWSIIQIKIRLPGNE